MLRTTAELSQSDVVARRERAYLVEDTRRESLSTTAVHLKSETMICYKPHENCHK